jgi:hypothetical protein
MGKESFESRGFPADTSHLVDQVKQKAGELDDLYGQLSIEPGAEGGRMLALAKTNLEQSVMWFVKGVSRSVKKA